MTPKDPAKLQVPAHEAEQYLTLAIKFSVKSSALLKNHFNGIYPLGRELLLAVKKMSFLSESFAIFLEKTFTASNLRSGKFSTDQESVRTIIRFLLSITTTQAEMGDYGLKIIDH